MITILNIGTTEKIVEGVEFEKSYTEISLPDIRAQIDYRFGDKKVGISGWTDVTSRDELVKRYANARTTFYGCGGHNKAKRNEQKMQAYRKAIKERGWKLPMPAELNEIGVFNGVGSY